MRILNYNDLPTANREAIDLLQECECRIVEELRSDNVSDLNLWLVNIDSQEFLWWIEDTADEDEEQDAEPIMKIRKAFELLESVYGEGLFLLEWT